MTMLRILSVTLFSFAAFACGDDGTPSDGSMDGRLGGEGDACATFTDCQPGLDCIMNICTAGSPGAVGDACIYTSSCMDGLYCSNPRTCQPEGGGTRFSSCTDSGDCALPLVCARQGDGSFRCVDDGGGDIGPPGDPCETVADCLAGLFCTGGVCTGQGGDIPDGGMDGGADASDAMLGGPCESVSDCDDMSVCTIDQCVGVMCRYTLSDGDEDGYASNLLGACGRDCNDMDPAVNPDHTAFETTQHTNPLNPLRPPSFDWNCDGTEQMQWPGRVPNCDSTDCTMGEGWGGGVPLCGMAGSWVRCTGLGGGCRLETVETRTQSCR